MRWFSCSVRMIGAMLSIGMLSVGASEGTAEQAKKIARLNCGARVDYVTPDSRPRNTQAPMLIADDDTIRCPLHEGETTFVVALPHPCSLERLKFVNENVAVRGTLKIAVSNEELPPKSDRWQPVDGSVAFHQKRLFNLSVVGLDAKFLRVTFRVEGEKAAEDFGLALSNFGPVSRGLLGWESNRLSAKPTAFGESLALSRTAPLIAALNP
jgi:hypothetical protein